MVFHLSGHFHHNMPYQVTWLFLIKKAMALRFRHGLWKHQLIMLFFAIVKGQPFAIMLSSGFLREYMPQFKGRW